MKSTEQTTNIRLERDFIPQDEEEREYHKDVAKEDGDVYILEPVARKSDIKYFIRSNYEEEVVDI